MGAAVEIPDFPVPELDASNFAFGASASDYLTREQLGPEFYYGRHPMFNVAEKLFYGGSLAQHGLKVRDDLDRKRVMNAIRGLLGSFAPKHEIKIGTVGAALAQWCEPVSTTEAA